MIVLENATKFYKTNQEKKYILKNVTMTIPSNTNIGILGRNGAGKSTLLRMLGGIDFPNSGKIYSDKSFSWPMGLNGGFQGSMTGRQNVKFVCRIFNKSEKEIKKIIEFVKDFSELGDYFDMPIKIYSSGMRSRLSFGMSLAFDFDYLLIDETLSVGDAKFKKKSKDALMKKLKHSNVLMVSHSISDLKNICDAGIIINNGEIEYYSKIEDAIQRYKEINLLGDDVSKIDIKQFLYSNRETFIELTNQIFIINDNIYFEILLKQNRFLIHYKLNDKFFEDLNPTTKKLFDKILISSQENIVKLEREIIRNFIGFLARFKPKNIIIFFQKEWITNSLFFRRLEFFKKNIQKHKFIKIINKPIEINKMEII